MKIIRTYTIQESTFWDYMEEQLLADINQATSKPLKAIPNGFHFEKKVKYGAPLSITIDCFEKGKCYKAIVKSGQETIVNTYTTRLLDNGKLEIVFEEVISTFEKEKATMSTLKRKYYEFTYLTRMARLLGNMYEAMLQKEKGIIAPSLPGKKAMKRLANVFEHND